MGTEKRERQKQARQARMEAQAKAAERAKLRHRLVVGSVIAVVVVIGLITYSAVSGDDGDDEVSTDTTSAADAGDDTGTDGTDVDADDGSTVEAVEPTCPPEEGADERVTAFTEAPPECIDPDSDYQAVVTTNLGEMTWDLRTDTAPETVNNFVFLSRWNYYDGVPFHRVSENFVAQAGDPSDLPVDQLGRGGPGYTISDELPESTDEYTPGVVAMANAGPDTGGSQWFIYFGPNPLPTPAYAIFADVVEGFDTTAQAILDLGEGDAPPTEDVIIESIEITETG
ncbi:MAG: peptidylprolyl isomerase [Actinomycetota bacterium]|nr:peptidylprolyl isomerase [Actinomycetota bacterium]